MPRQPIRILSTRSLDAALKDLATAKGIRVDAIPFIATTPVRDEALGREVSALSRLPLAAVFTSMNSVEAIANILGPDGEKIPWDIFSIQAATRQLAEKYFGKNRVRGSAPSAAALADEIISWWAGSPRAPRPPEVFFFCGDQRRDELPDRLRRGGIKVNEVMVYRTEQTPHVIEEIYEGVVFFSPSAVHSFFSKNKVPATVILFAIGEATAGTIRVYSANQVVCSASPAKEALIKQVIDHFQIRL